MTNLTGTDKQIAWATDILAQYRAANETFAQFLDGYRPAILTPERRHLDMLAQFEIDVETFPTWEAWLDSLTDAAEVISLLRPDHPWRVGVRRALRRYAESSK